MFEVLSKLGAGGMADVFLARGEVAGQSRLVALKRMRISTEQQPDAVSRFTREAQFGRLLHHPCVVQLLDAGVDAQGPYLAMEYVQGATAVSLVNGEVRRGGSLPLEVASIICRDAAEGIAYAHALEHGGSVGLLHRDISPDNLLVGFDGRCKVSDFGIARFEGQTQITSTGEVRGKLSYLAPELFQGQAHSAASDVFALAATVFRVFAGVPAFRGSNDADLMRNVMFVAPPRLTELRPDLPAPVADWVQRALSTDPAQRPGADELVTCLSEPDAAARNRLSAWVRERVPSTPPPEALLPQQNVATARFPVSSASPPPRRGRALLAAAGVVAIAAVTLTLVFARSEPKHDAVPPPPTPSPAPVVVTSPEVPAPAVVAVKPPVVETPPVEPAPAKNVKRARRGTLDVHVSPFGDVFVDGNLVGTTPLKPIELPVGAHHIIVANTSLNARRTYKVMIEPEKKTRLDADLRAAAGASR